MIKSGEIRVLALGFICQGERIFLGEGYDPEQQENFYRALGGGVDFGETSLEALQREFQEEIQAELTNIRYLGCLESIFEFRGKSGHEIIQLYECDFVDPKFYTIERVVFKEGDRPKAGVWVNLRDCKSGKLRVVPPEFLDYL